MVTTCNCHGRRADIELQAISEPLGVSYIKLPRLDHYRFLEGTADWRTLEDYTCRVFRISRKDFKQLVKLTAVKPISYGFPILRGEKEKTISLRILQLMSRAATAFAVKSASSLQKLLCDVIAVIRLLPSQHIMFYDDKLTTVLSMILIE